MKITIRFFVLALIICCLLIAGYFFYWWFHQPVSSQPSAVLSDQSQQRIGSMQESGEISTNIQSIKNEGGEVFSTSCFQAVIPLPFSTVRPTEEKMGKCLLRAQLVNPRGTLVIHSEFLPQLSSLADVSGVLMRQQSDEYEPILIQSIHPSTLAFKSETELTIFLHQQSWLVSISFSDLGIVDQEIIDAAQTTLDSIEVFSVE
jgi:hypothetical protein